MSATVQDVAYAALAAVDSKAGLALVGKWVNERYQALAAKTRFRHLRQAGLFVVPALVTAGTVTVTTGSATVTGNGAAAAVWGPVRGRYFRGTATWYRIVDVGATTLTLEDTFSEPSITAGAYVIAQRYASMPAGARFFRSFTLARLWQPLDVMSLGELDAYAPNRPYNSSYPQIVADAGEDPETRQRLVELFPYSLKDEAVSFVWWRAPESLALDDLIPGVLDPYVLKEGVLIDLYRYEMIQLARKGDVNGAALLRNEARAQMTTWQTVMQDAARQDRGMDDTTAMLRMLQLRGASRGDIVTATDQIWAAGVRP